MRRGDLVTMAVPGDFGKPPRLVILANPSGARAGAWGARPSHASMP
jgi:hypothetical protein